jgi:hypothetical protein
MEHAVDVRPLFLAKADLPIVLVDEHDLSLGAHIWLHRTQM